MTAKEKERLLQQTEKLKELDLPIPRSITATLHRLQKQFSKKWDKMPYRSKSWYDFYDYISEKNGRLFQRIFFIKVHKDPSKDVIREVARRYEGGKIVCSNLIGGYGMCNPLLPDLYSTGYEMHDSGWAPQYAYISENADLKLARESITVNTDFWLKKYPYCQWEEYQKPSQRGYYYHYYCYDFYTFLCRYRKNPKIELLIKAGYKNFVGISDKLNFSGKGFEGVFGVDKRWASYLKNSEVNDLYIIKKNPWLLSESDLNSFKCIKKEYGKGELTEKLFRYLATQDRFYVHQYKDYLRFVDRLALPHKSSVLYPDDLHAAHNDLYEKVTVLNSKEKDEQIKAWSEKCKDLIWESKKAGYIVFPVQCSKQLFEESKALSHCVKNYCGKIAAGDSMIFFVRKLSAKDVPFVTLEVSRNKASGIYDSIVQVRGEHDNKPDDDTAKFVMSWKKKFNLSGWSQVAA